MHHFKKLVEMKRRRVTLAAITPSSAGGGKTKEGFGKGPLDLVLRNPGTSKDGKSKQMRDKNGNIRTLPALKEVNVKRMQRIRDRRKSPAVIPWKLLDELEGEKKRFENEKSYVEFNYKY